ncbi:hypothetical protein BB559_006256 [Furculomyces boomerangus]|uniref:Uncharacterized protein n=1 Tax=Furculomyces boomerangus TaxID=61424 RepID=A0A2T9Y3Y3_9FUNG|nr:hypothetical protein BB559_006256 [Furculomyces boomerangus]
MYIWRRLSGSINHLSIREDNRQIIILLTSHNVYSINGIANRVIIKEYCIISEWRCLQAIPQSKYILEYRYQKAKETEENLKILKNNERFSTTVDEWTGTQKKKIYGNKHTTQKRNTINLGLVQKEGSCPADILEKLVSERLETFGLELQKNM